MECGVIGENTEEQERLVPLQFLACRCAKCRHDTERFEGLTLFLTSGLLVCPATKPWCMESKEAVSLH